MAQYKVAVIRGDGIGVEVIEEGIKVLEALSEQFDISWRWLKFLTFSESLTPIKFERMGCHCERVSAYQQ